MRKKKFIHIYSEIEDLKKFLVSKEFMNSKEGYNPFDNDPIPEYKNHDFDKPFLTMESDKLEFIFEHTFIMYTIVKHFSNEKCKIILTVEGAEEEGIVPTVMLEDFDNPSKEDLALIEKGDMSPYTTAAGLHDFMASNLKKNAKYMIKFYDLKPSDYDTKWLCDMLFNFKYFPKKFIKERLKNYEIVC